MPDIAKKFRRQYAVYWEAGPDNEFARPTFKEPVEVRCRWDDVTEAFINRQGNQTISSAIVLVDRDMVEGSFLWLGKLEELESLEHTGNERAMVIQKFERIPDIKAKNFIYTAYL